MSDASSSMDVSRSQSPDSVSSDLAWHSSCVLDIGGGRMSGSLTSEVERKFLWKNGQFQQHRLLPASVLHDDKGLKMWRGMTRLPQYYQTRDEIEMLQENGEELVKQIGGSHCLIDLGCGDVRKIQPLLDAFEDSKIHVQYFALDLSLTVLEESLQELKPRYKYVDCYGLWGTFDHALDWVPRHLRGPKCYLSLGSMFGNDHFDAAIARLKSWRDIMTPDDRLLLGLDATQDKETIWNSYHDPEGVFHQFVRNGFAHSNFVLGHKWYHDEDWNISGEFTDNPLMHQFTAIARRNVRCEPLGINFPKGEKIVCYEGFKYDPMRMQKQFAAASLKKTKQWKSPSGRIYQYLLQRTAAPETKK